MKTQRNLVLGTIVLAGTLTLSVQAYQQPAASAPKVVEVDKIKDNLWVLKGGGGNTAVFVTATGITVVDTKNPGWGQPILDAIKKISDKPIVRIINTHTHGDHVSGNVEFPATVDIVVQENTKGHMEAMRPVTGLTPPPPGPSIFQQNQGKGLAKRTFKDTMTIGKGAEQIDLHYFGRAHTNGDAWVVFTALNVMHCGDAFHTRDLPIMDANNGGSGLNYSATLAKASQVKGVDTLINGHNATTTTPADLKTQSEFIADFVKFVQDAKKGGKTVEDVVKTWKTPEKYKGYATAAEGRIRADAQVIWDETK
jgi:glyoxylase-like metal-dependent hydrolase (beta-lactamase superfamily II)